MRPAGDVRIALLDACRTMVTAERAPTMREIAYRACVGVERAEATVKNMVRARQLRVVRDRKVEYRNRPVAEYMPADMAGADDGFVDLAQVLRAWG